MSFFKPNIGPMGRAIRAGGGVLLIAGTFGAGTTLPWAALPYGLGVFMLFEAARGWCVARACGINTPL